MTQESRPKKESDLSSQTTSWQYLGRELDITDAQGSVTKQFARVSGVAGRSVDAGGYFTTFGYDAFGSLTSVVDSSSNSLYGATFDYGVGAYRLTSHDLDRGNWLYGVDALGEVTSYTDANANNITFGIYDPLGRPSTRTEPATSSTATLITSWTWGKDAASHNIGQLAAVSSTAGGTLSYSDSYSFDTAGRVITETITPSPIGAQTFSVKYDPNTALVVSDSSAPS